MECELGGSKDKWRVLVAWGPVGKVLKRCKGACASRKIGG